MRITVLVTILLMSFNSFAGCVLATFSEQDFPFVVSVLKHDHRVTTSIPKLKNSENPNIPLFMSFGLVLGSDKMAQDLSSTLKGESNADSLLFGKAQKIIGTNDCKKLRRDKVLRNSYGVF